MIALTVVFVLFGIARFATTTYDSDEYAYMKAVENLSGSKESR